MVRRREGERKEEQAPAICRHVVNFRYLPCVVTGDFVFSAMSKKEKKKKTSLELVLSSCALHIQRAEPWEAF